MSGTPKLGTVCPSPYPLWSGRRVALTDPRHCDLPFLNGYLPYRPPRGTCEIPGASPNLWFAVVPALRFWISSIRFPDGPFVDLCGAVCPGASILAATPRRCNRLPDVVFLDLLLLPRSHALLRHTGGPGRSPTSSSSGVGTRIRRLWVGGDGLPRLLPGPHRAGRSGMLGSHTARLAGRPRAVGGLWSGTRLHGRRRCRHPLTPSRGSQSARRCWIGSLRRQCVPALHRPTRYRWQRWCASRPTVSAGWGLGRSTNGGFSLRRPSPPLSSSPQWAVLRVWVFVRSPGQSLRPSGTSRFSSRIACLRLRAWIYCGDFACRLLRRSCSWAPTLF